MAAPPEKTLKDLTGDWIMDKELSDDTDAVLALQGVPWLKRKAIAWATVTLHVKEYEQDGETHIDIEQTATGGIKGTTEIRVLNWTDSEHEDDIFGKIKGKSRWVPNLSEGESGGGGKLDPYLLEGWLAEDGGHIQSYADNEERKWTAEQIWGFTEINGSRRYTRRVVVKKGSEVLKVRLVYLFQPKA